MAEALSRVSQLRHTPKDGVFEERLYKTFNRREMNAIEK